MSGHSIAGRATFYIVVAALAFALPLLWLWLRMRNWKVSLPKREEPKPLLGVVHPRQSMFENEWGF